MYISVDDLKSLYIFILPIFLWVPLGFVGFGCGVNRRVEDLGFGGGIILEMEKMRMRQQVLLDHLKPESGPRASANVVVSLRYHSTLFSSLRRCSFAKRFERP